MGPATLALAVGTQAPDLVDKPLAWTIGVLPSGRAGLHSLLIALPLLIGVGWLLRDHAKRSLWVAFTCGYLTHLMTDGLYPFLAGDWSSLSFLLWPVLSLPAYTESPGILAHFAAMDVTLTLIFEAGLFVLATLVWVADGMPGLRLLGRALHRQYTRVLA